MPTAKPSRLSALPAGFVLSVGDYISITVGSARDLHQVMEAATANGSGTTAEIRDQAASVAGRHRSTKAVRSSSQPA